MQTNQAQLQRNVLKFLSSCFLFLMAGIFSSHLGHALDPADFTYFLEKNSFFHCLDQASKQVIEIECRGDYKQIVISSMNRKIKEKKFIEDTFCQVDSREKKKFEGWVNLKILDENDRLVFRILVSQKETALGLSVVSKGFSYMDGNNSKKEIQCNLDLYR